MSKYGYFEVFQSPLEFEITRVDCICTKRTLKSTCASALSDQSLRCQHEETLPSKSPSEYSDQTARMQETLTSLEQEMLGRGA